MNLINIYYCSNDKRYMNQINIHMLHKYINILLNKFYRLPTHVEEPKSSANPYLHTQYLDDPISLLSVEIQVLQLSILSQVSQLQSQGTQLS